MCYFFKGLFVDRPTNPSDDDCYWATDTRELYRSVGDNNWVFIYKPYDDPHPFKNDTILGDYTDPPPMPTGFTITSSNYYSISLSWDDIVDEECYIIYRSDDGGSTFSKIAETTSTYSTYLDASVTSGNTYSYYVKSLTWDGECDSNVVEITVPTSRTR